MNWAYCIFWKWMVIRLNYWICTGFKQYVKQRIFMKMSYSLLSKYLNRIHKTKPTIIWQSVHSFFRTITLNVQWSQKALLSRWTLHIKRGVFFKLLFSFFCKIESNLLKCLVLLPSHYNLIFFYLDFFLLKFWIVFSRFFCYTKIKNKDKTE